MKPKAQIQFTELKKAKLLKDLSVKFDGLKFTVKKGYITDGASIPKLLAPIGGYPFSGDTLDAAIMHDIFYQTRRYSRFTCDYNFLFLMKKYNVFILKRWAYFFAVRLFGWAAYGFHKAGVEENAKMFLSVRKCARITR
jgi:hypothetical protein